MKKNKVLKIDQEFKDIISPLTEEEFNGLKESIINEGCRDPLVTWNNIILDGHNRYKICNEGGIIFSTVEKNFDNRDRAKIWIIDNQLGKRNLNNAQRIDLVDKLFGLKEKVDSKQRMSEGGKKKGVEKLPPLEVGKSRDKLGKKAKVSGKTYQKAIKVKEKAPELWNKCLSGDMSIEEASRSVNGMTDHNRQVIFSSKHDNWGTPKKLYDQLNEEFHFDFDPCPLKPTFDGLKIDWKENNFINPPYSNIKGFLEKGHKELNNKSKILVYLIPVRTDTEWFHTYVYPHFKKEKKPYCDIRFIKGRVKFTNGDPKPQSAPFPSMIVIFRSDRK